MSKPKNEPAQATPEPANYRSNPEVDARIDSYIRENPKHWAYVQSMPRERLERSMILQEVREIDRQQRMREGVMKQINSNPATRQAYETLVKDLPEDQRETVMTQLARQTRRAIARSHSQGVKV